MSAETELYQEVLLEHKRAPRNFGSLPTATHHARGSNPSCGDDLSVELEVEGDSIRQIRFHGVGCAICVASASMMTEAVQGRSVEVAHELQQRFRGVLTGTREPDRAQMGKLVTLAGVRRYPARIKCALLGWHALAHALGQQDAPLEPGAQVQS